MFVIDHNMKNSRRLLRTMNFNAIIYTLSMAILVYAYQASPLRNYLVYLCLVGICVSFISQFAVLYLIYLERQAEKYSNSIAENAAAILQCTRNIKLLESERDAFIESIDMDTVRLMKEINQLDTEAERVEATRKAVAYLTEKYKSKKTHEPNKEK